MTKLKRIENNHAENETKRSVRQQAVAAMNKKRMTERAKMEVQREKDGKILH